MITKILEEFFIRKNMVCSWFSWIGIKIIETRRLESHGYASGRSGGNGFPDGEKDCLLAVFIIEDTAALWAVEDDLILFQFDEELGRDIHVASLANFSPRFCYCIPPVNAEEVDIFFVEFILDGLCYFRTQALKLCELLVEGGFFRFYLLRYRIDLLFFFYEYGFFCFDLL